MDFLTSRLILILHLDFELITYSIEWGYWELCNSYIVYQWPYLNNEKEEDSVQTLLIKRVHCFEVNRFLWWVFCGFSNALKLQQTVFGVNIKFSHCHVMFLCSLTWLNVSMLIQLQFQNIVVMLRASPSSCPVQLWNSKSC